MISQTPPPNLPNETRVRDVSSNFLTLVKDKDNKDYKEDYGAGNGVHVTGQLPNNNCITVTGLASCGALIIMKRREFLAIHIGGDARNIKLYKTVVRGFCANETNLIIAAACGAGGSEDNVYTEFNDKISKYTGINDTNFSVFLNVNGIGISSTGTIGLPRLEPAVQGQRVRRHSSCCILM